MINMQESLKEKTIKDAFDGGLESFKAWLESLPNLQKQQVIKLLSDNTGREAR